MENLHGNMHVIIYFLHFSASFPPPPHYIIVVKGPLRLLWRVSVSLYIL